MLTKILHIYDKNIKFIGTLVEQIYLLSMTVMIFLGHNVDGFISTYPYKIFAAMFMAFGLWSYEIKKAPFKIMSLEILIKFLTITLSAIIIAKLTGEMKLTSLYNGVFYPVFTIVAYSILNKKSNWGKNFRGSSKEYLNYKFGRSVSVVPRIILFFAIIIPGIVNTSTTVFVFFLIIGFIIEYVFVWLCFKKSKQLNMVK